MSDQRDVSIFLETTIQISKIFGDPNSKRDKIVKIIRENYSLSSTYVLKEFRVGFLKAAIDFYNLLVDSADVPEAIRRSTNFFGRKPGKMARVYSVIMEDLGNTICTKDAVLRRLDYYIDGYLENRFFEDVKLPLIDKTGCVCGEMKPNKDDENNIWEYSPRCNKKNKNSCSICQFVNNNEKYLRQLATCHNGQPFDDETTKRVKAVQKIFDDNDLPYGNNCRQLSDWLICLEVPSNASLFTTNYKHFKLPCELLNKKMKTL